MNRNDQQFCMQLVSNNYKKGFCVCNDNHDGIIRILFTNLFHMFTVLSINTRLIHEKGVSNNLLTLHSLFYTP